MQPRRYSKPCQFKGCTCPSARVGAATIASGPPSLEVYSPRMEQERLTSSLRVMGGGAGAAAGGEHGGALHRHASIMLPPVTVG